MKIIVNDVAAQIGGAKSILEEFYRYLIESKDKNEWYFLLSDTLIEETDNIHIILLPNVKKNWFNRLKFDFYGGRKVINDIGADAVLNFQNTKICCSGIKQYLYIHQSIPFQKAKKFSFLRKEERIYAIYQYCIGTLIKHSVKKADGVFVQTEWMKKSLSEITDSEKIKIVPPTVYISEEAASQTFNIDLKQFFYPSGKIIYKNHQCISDAVGILVNQNISDFSVTLTIPEENAEFEQIKCIGMLPREDVMKNYRTKILLFPSYIETYGMPLAEARKMGGIIFAADTEFSREILSGYENAYFFNPFDANELAELMKRAINKDINILPAKKHDDVQKNSWELVIDQISESVT